LLKGNINFILKHKIIITADGSKTIYIEEWDEQYHSKYGAIQEAKHVFIKHGLYEVLTLHKIFTIKPHF